MKEIFLKPGQFFDRDRGLVEPTNTPGHISCRRLEDFPTGKIPETAAADNCARCHAVILYNPDGPTFANNPPRICMQCAGIEPLPL